MNSRKKRFKLYKSGKQWITAAIISIGFVAGTQVKHVHADTTTNNQVQATQTTQNTTENNDNQTVTLTVANNKNEDNSLCLTKSF